MFLHSLKQLAMRHLGAAMGWLLIVGAVFLGTIATASAQAPANAPLKDTPLETTDRLNVRSGPGLGNRVITTLTTPGTVGTILSEPVQAGIYYWVKVRFTTPQGVVEGYVATDFARSLQNLSLPRAFSGYAVPGVAISAVPSLTNPIQNPTIATPNFIPTNTTVVFPSPTAVRTVPGATQPEVIEVRNVQGGMIESGPVTIDGALWYEVKFPTVTQEVMSANGMISVPVTGWVPVTAFIPLPSTGQTPQPTQIGPSTPSAPTAPPPPAEIVISPAPSLANGQSVRIEMVARDVRETGGEGLGIVAQLGQRYHQIEFYGDDSRNAQQKLEAVFGDLELLEESNFFIEITRRGNEYQCVSSVLVRRTDQRDLNDAPYGAWDFGSFQNQPFDCTPRAGTTALARINNTQYTDIANWTRRENQQLQSFETFGGEGG